MKILFVIFALLLFLTCSKTETSKEIDNSKQSASSITTKLSQEISMEADIDNYLKSINLDQVKIADLHNDVAMKIFFDETVNYTDKSTKLEMSIDKLIKGKAGIIVYAIFVPDYFSEKTVSSNHKLYENKVYERYPKNPATIAEMMITKLKEELGKHPNSISIATSYADIISNLKSNKISAIISLEGAHSLDGKLENLEKFYNMGVRALGLTWNNDNPFASSQLSSNSAKDYGLTSLGKKLINKMIDLNMIIDLSHSSEKTFYDVSEILLKDNYPMIASHSNTFALCKIKRNLTDDQIDIISRLNGIIGMNFHMGQITREDIKKPEIEYLLDHINHIKNINNSIIALGSDYDGFIKPPKEISNFSEINNLTLKMKELNYSDDEIKNILIGNTLKFLKSLWKNK